MLVVATSVLGHVPEAEDAVQEAALVALLRIGDLRDVDAVGPWLRAVVRNACRMRLRARSDLPLEEHQAAQLPSTEPDPADLLDRIANRDWLWTALGELSPDQRLALVLQHLAGLSAYRDIAATLQVPIGTVRSRLAAARQRLATALVATADAAHDDVATVTRVRHTEAAELLAAANRGDLASALGKYLSPAVESTWPHGPGTIGSDYILRGMASDVADGVRHHLTGVVAGLDLACWEIELSSPPENPEHCPPGALWVLRLEDGRVRQTHLFHRPRL